VGPVFGKDHALSDKILARCARSVPSVQLNQPDPRWNSCGALPQGAPPATAPSQGGSSLVPRQAGAAGVIGARLLLNSISSMFGHRGSAFAGDAPASGSPWAAAPPTAIWRATPAQRYRTRAGGNATVPACSIQATMSMFQIWVAICQRYGGDVGGDDSA